MTELPITHMTLYKHGVGFFQRRAQMEGEAITLTFRVEEMNDILKSLTAVDQGGGQVRNINYATPKSVEERLAGCTIRLADDRSLRDLLVSLRGRMVRLALDQEQSLQGTLLGLDEVNERQELAASLVSVLAEESNQVDVVPLSRVLGVELLDERGAGDLRFFLSTAVGQEDYRQVTIRLTPGSHDLLVSYIAPAPTWRVSYRLVAEPEAEDGPETLLLAWGIFDNQLEEDLEDISLSLVAGMPISFIYDLYTPFTPERPVVEEESRTAAAPVDFEQAVGAGVLQQEVRGMTQPQRKMMRAMAPPPAPAAEAAFSGQALEDSVAVSASGESMGELFQYNIGTPVSVGRGQSAMVPILATRLGYRKDLLYNGRKLPKHPVATLRLKNESGLTLERGPVTVIENSDYVGEAVLPFTADGGELVVAYSVELSIKVSESQNSRREIHRLSVSGVYLVIEEWEIRSRSYQVNNKTNETARILIEHPRNSNYTLFETADPFEKTDDFYRFEAETPAQGETTLQVQERRLLSRREELRRQSFVKLQRFLKRGLLNRDLHDKIGELLLLWEKIEQNEKEITAVGKAREKIYKSQQQIQGNMQALSSSGKEGALRARYVDQLENSETELKALAQKEKDLQKAIKQWQKEIETKVQAL